MSGQQPSKNGQPSPMREKPKSGAMRAELNEVNSIFDWVDGNIEKHLNTRVVILIVVSIFMIYFVMNALAGSGSETDNREQTLTSDVSILEIFLWAIFIVIVVVNGFQYFFDTNLTAEIKNILSPKPEVVITQKLPAEPDAVGGSGDLGTGPSLKMRKQVFHIPANVYDYDNAKALCEAYGAKLANIDQMEEAHKSGAEWCSYGWSDHQMILYPTQKSTWEELQKSTDPAKKNSCGRPGINGGYMNNASMKVGVNCYGPKPDINPASSKLMASIQNYEAGKMLDPLHEARVQEMKSKINDVVIAPFNKGAWSLL
jgi:Extracellular link domain